MRQRIQGVDVEVIKLDNLPDLPITGLTRVEAYNQFMRLHNPIGMGAQVGGTPLITYAEALNDALENGIISRPGKYGIWISETAAHYEIYEIKE
jgi:hypothetical protein